MTTRTKYAIYVRRDFDPDDRGLPDGDVEEAFEYAALHSALPDETWELVDKDTGKVLATYEE